MHCLTTFFLPMPIFSGLIWATRRGTARFHKEYATKMPDHGIHIDLHKMVANDSSLLLIVTPIQSTYHSYFPSPSPILDQHQSDTRSFTRFFPTAKLLPMKRRPRLPSRTYFSDRIGSSDPEFASTTRTIRIRFFRVTTS